MWDSGRGAATGLPNFRKLTAAYGAFHSEVMLSPSHTPEDWLWLAPSLQAWVRNARSNWGPVFADSDDRDFRNQPAVVSQAKNSPGMLPRLFLGNELFDWPGPFRRQKLNFVICHFVILSVEISRCRDAIERSLPYRQELGKAVHR